MAKSTKFKTLPGTAVYPKTHQAVRWDQELNRSVPDPKGSFECDVAFAPGPAVEQLKKVVRECAAEAKIKAKNVPFRAETDEDGNETGRIIFKFKQYGTDRDGNERRLAHFGMDGKPLAADFRLTSGSTVKIAGRPQAYKQLGGGVRFLVDAILVVEYVAFENNPFADETSVDEGETSVDEEAPVDTDDEDSTDF